MPVEFNGVWVFNLISIQFDGFCLIQNVSFDALQSHEPQLHSMDVFFSFFPTSQFCFLGAAQSSSKSSKAQMGTGLS